jgi:LmbE family N-acetylglucosaminyl deacetylase
VFVEERPLDEAHRSVIKLSLAGKDADPLTVLCIGAHADDIEIGCGGTVLYLTHALSRVKFHWVVFSTPGPRRQEAWEAAELFTKGCEKEVVLEDYRDGFLPYSGGQLKDFFEKMKGQVNPHLIFTPWRGDAHQDHRLLAELAWNTFRNHLILEYEIPKYDGDMGRPNLFVPLDAPLYEHKVEYLLQAFKSQRVKPWFDRETFLGLTRIRGMESNSPSGHAEAFHVRKAVLQAGV